MVIPMTADSFKIIHLERSMLDIKYYPNPVCSTPRSVIKLQKSCIYSAEISRRPGRRLPPTAFYREKCQPVFLWRRQQKQTFTSANLSSNENILFPHTFCDQRGPAQNNYIF